MTPTLITVTVVAADGSTQQDYTVTVTRAASSDATLSRAWISLEQRRLAGSETFMPPLRPWSTPSAVAANAMSSMVSCRGDGGE